MGSQKQIALLNIVKDPQLLRHVNELNSFFLVDPADTIVVIVIAVVAVTDGNNDCSVAVFGISANLFARVVIEQSVS